MTQEQGKIYSKFCHFGLWSLEDDNFFEDFDEDDCDGDNVLHNYDD